MYNVKLLFPSSEHQPGCSLRSLKWEEGQCPLFVSFFLFWFSLSLGVGHWEEVREAEQIFLPLFGSTTIFYWTLLLLLLIPPHWQWPLEAGTQTSVLPVGYMCECLEGPRRIIHFSEEGDTTPTPSLSLLPATRWPTPIPYPPSLSPPSPSKLLIPGSWYPVDNPLEQTTSKRAQAVLPTPTSPVN